jgi:predicted transcriptional regulator
LSEILVLNYRKREIPVEDRINIILSKKERKALEKRLHITDQVVRYSIHNLRKAGIITDKGLSKVVAIIPDKDFRLSFNFKIAEDAKED